MVRLPAVLTGFDPGAPLIDLAVAVVVEPVPTDLRSPAWNASAARTDLPRRARRRTDHAALLALNAAQIRVAYRELTRRQGHGNPPQGWRPRLGSHTVA
jgi:hypothetical protein